MRFPNTLFPLPADNSDNHILITRREKALLLFITIG